MKKKTTTPPQTELRRAAESKVKARPQKQTAASEAARLVHELEVHQIELEMQNEELVQSRAAAEQALAQYTDLYDFAPIGYFTLTRNGTIRQTNLIGARLLNLDRSELIKRRLGIFVAASSRADFNTFLEKVFSREESQTCEVALTIEVAGTDPRWVHLEAARSEDGETCRTVIVDITARRQMEEALRESEKKYRDIYENVSDVIYETDNHGHITSISPSVEKQAGYRPAELIGRSVTDFFIQPEQYAALDRRMIENGSVNDFEALFRRKDGRTVFVSITAHIVFDETGHSLATAGVLRDINARQQAEAALRESEERFRAIFEQAAMGVARIDSKTGEFKLVNQRYADIIGYSRAELTGTTFQALTHPDDLVADLNNMQRLISGEIRLFSMEKRYQRKDNSLVWVNLTVSPTWASGAEPSQHIAIVEDITARKQAEEELRQARDQLEQRVQQRTAELSQTNAALQAEITERKQVEEKLRESEQRFASAFNSSPIAIGIRRLSDDVIVEWNPAFEKMIGYTREQVVGQRIRDLPFYIEPEDRAPVLEKAERREAIHGMEMQIRAAASAVKQILMSVDYFALQGEEYALASFVDITDRKRAEETLNARELDYRNLFEAATDSIFVTDAQGRYLEVNRQGCDLLGYSRAELVQMRVHDMIPADRLPATVQRLAELRPDKANLVEQQMLRKDGTLVSVEVHSRALPDGRLLAVIRDITGRQQIEEKLRESESRSRAILEAIPDLMFRIDRHGVFLDYRAKQADELYVPSEAIVGHNLAESLPPDIATLALRNIQLTLDSGQVQTFEYSLPYPAGPRYYEARMSVRSPDDVVAVVRDITDRKQAEENLRQAEVQYRTLVERMPGILYITRPGQPTQSSFVSPQISLLGYTPEEWVTSDPELWAKHIQPDDRARVLAAVEHSRATGEPFKAEYRILTQDGRVLWFLDEAQDTFDAAGQFLFRQGFMLDITERKHAEEELKKLSRVTVQIADGVLITDRNGNIEFVNPAWEELTGYPQSEAIGQTPRLLKSGRHTQTYYKSLWQTILAGEIHRGITINRKKNGELYYEEKAITPLKNEQGEITHFVSTGRDITERRRIEADLTRYVDQLAAMDKMARVVTSSLDLEIVLDRVIAGTRPLLKAEGISVLLLENKTELVFAAVSGVGADGLRRQRIPANVGVAGEAIQTGNSIRVRKPAERQLIYRDIEKSSGYHTQSLLAVPLALGKTIIGVIEAVHHKADAFGADDLSTLELAANWTSIAIGNARQYAESQQRLKEREALAAISQTLNETLDLDRVLQLIAVSARRVIPNADHAVIHLLDEAQRILNPVASDGLNERGKPDLSLQPGEGIAGQVIKQGMVINIADTEQDERYVPLGLAIDLRSLLVAPVQSGPRRLGTISVQSVATHAFSSDDERLLTTLGVQAAIAIENARLYAAIQEEHQRLLVLYELSRALSAMLDSQLILDHAVRLITDFVGGTLGIGYRFDPKTQRLHLRTLINAPDLAAIQSDASFDLRLGEGLIGWVADQREPVRVDDVRHDLHWKRSAGFEDQIQSALAVPLLSGDQLLGTICVESRQLNAFSADHLELVVALSRQVSVALENARLYDELRQALDEREAAQAQLLHSEKMAALGRLIASLAHEINNPLQSVQSCLTLAEEEVDGAQRVDKLHRYLKVAATEIERIAALVRRMREFYRPTHGGMQPTDIQAVLRSVLELTAKDLQHKHVRVQPDWSADLPVLLANADHLKQVFLNLILNAADAMSDGGTLTIRPRSDMLPPDGERAARPAVRIEFTDTGIGMSPEIQARLFEPFFTTKDSGSGLGLSVSYGIIQAHNGQIEVVSQVGAGSTFSVLLPIQSEE